jgi:hypothetical protein
MNNVLGTALCILVVMALAWLFVSIQGRKGEEPKPDQRIEYGYDGPDGFSVVLWIVEIILGIGGLWLLVTGIRWMWNHPIFK